MSNPELLPTIEREPEQPVTGCVIWLHGLGADGHDFEALVPRLGLPPEHGIRFVFPHAPRRPVTINNGLVMRAWFDLRNPDLTQGEDEEGIRVSAAQLLDLIQAQEQRGLPASRVVLAGFSQGGAIALHAGIRCPRRLAGVLALSTYLPMADRVTAETVTSARDLPVLVAHGDDDPVIPIGAAQDTVRILEGLGVNVRYRNYPMGHAVCDEEMLDIQKWLIQVFATQDRTGNR